MKYEEKEDKDTEVIDLLTRNVAALTVAIQTQNDVILCLLHKFNVDSDLPAWTAKEEVEKEMGPKIQACVEAVRKIYGHSEADKD